MNASDNRFYREPGDAAMSERDLALAIHHEIMAPANIKQALDLWHYPMADEPGEARRMRLIMWIVVADAIDAVLARRQREAARTGPWEGPAPDTRWRHPVTGDTWIIDGRTGRAKAIVPAGLVGEREEGAP